MNLFLFGEIVEQVGLAHARDLGDLVDGGAAKAVDGENLERGFENDVLLFALDTRQRPRLCRHSDLGRR
ncbi:hypothetical protein D3C86_2038310 [compost metagenome]